MPRIGYAVLTADGGVRLDSRGGRIGSIGVVLRTSRGVLLGSVSQNIGPVSSHNVAEYRALIRGLELARERGVPDLRVFLDSTLVVDQLSGASNVRADQIKPYHEQATDLMLRFEKKIRVSWIPREWNTEADLLANLALDR